MCGFKITHSAHKPQFWNSSNMWTFDVRFDADCVMKNIYETFDSANTGNLDLITLSEQFLPHCKFSKVSNFNVVCWRKGQPKWDPVGLFDGHERNRFLPRLYLALITWFQSMRNLPGFSSFTTKTPTERSSRRRWRTSSSNCAGLSKRPRSTISRSTQNLPRKNARKRWWGKFWI